MKIRIELNRKELTELVVEELHRQLGGVFDPKKVRIETRSSQNYKSTWESADFRAVFEGNGE